MWIPAELWVSVRNLYIASEAGFPSSFQADTSRLPLSEVVFTKRHDQNGLHVWQVSSESRKDLRFHTSAYMVVVHRTCLEVKIGIRSLAV